MQPLNVLRFGRATDPTLPMALRAGPLEALFEPETAFLRRIRWGGELALLGIYGAVRDRNWGTVTPGVRLLHVATREEGFRLAFEALCRREEIAFQWQGEIEGRAAGHLRFRFSGEALTPFLRSRIGLCVLHDAASLLELTFRASFARSTCGWLT